MRVYFYFYRNVFCAYWYFYKTNVCKGHIECFGVRDFCILSLIKINCQKKNLLHFQLQLRSYLYLQFISINFNNYMTFYGLDNNYVFYHYIII